LPSSKISPNLSLPFASCPVPRIFYLLLPYKKERIVSLPLGSPVSLQSQESTGRRPRHRAHRGAPRG